MKKMSATDLEINRLCQERMMYDPLDNEYKILTDRISDLMTERKNSKKDHYVPTADTVFKCVFTGLLGIGIIFKEEVFGPVTSKAVNLVTKV